MASNGTVKTAPKSNSIAANKKAPVSRQKPIAAKPAASGNAAARKAPASSPALAVAATKTAATKTATKPMTRKAEPKASAKPVSAEKTRAPKAKVIPPAKKDAAQTAKDKVKKPKLVRDSFTMPEPEYRVLGEVKKACLKAGFEVKKSELLRVGVAMIKNMDLAGLKNVLATLPPLKAGRPKSAK